MLCTVFVTMTSPKNDLICVGWRQS